MTRVLLFIIMLFLMVPFTGCKKDKPVEIKPMAEKVKPAEQPGELQVAEAEKKTDTEGYNYESSGRRDPFLSLVEMTREKPKRKKGATPFESFDIDEIKLLAIAWDDNKYYALIMLPTQKAYTITEGMTLGIYDGKVVQISEDSVVIREYVKDYKGELKPRDSILKLHKGEGE